MSQIMLGSLAALTLTVPLPAQAQVAAENPQAKFRDTRGPGIQEPQRTGTYEDIEIMRRLLNEKLTHFYGATRFARINVKSACAKCHEGTPKLATFLDVDHDGKLDVIVGDSSECPAMTGRLSVLGDQATNLQRHYRDLVYKDDAKGYAGFVQSILRNTAAERLFPNTEGTYLKGHGVVFSVTLPPPSHDPRAGEAAKPASKPPSDWDRVRRDVRQEKPAAQEASKLAVEPSLADVILQVLADNGHRFSHLLADESLTVAVTFRSTIHGSGNQPVTIFRNNGNATFTDVIEEVGLESSSKEAASQPPTNDATGAKPGNANGTASYGQKAKNAGGPASTWQDYVLLGDLHFKQNKVDEAIKAYVQALELKPEPKHEATILQQLERSYRQAGKVPEARSTQRKAQELFQKLLAEQTQPARPADAKPATLPSKLVVSASKRSLDAVGSGKMSFEEFKKAASVEYLTFGGEKK